MDLESNKVYIEFSNLWAVFNWAIGLTYCSSNFGCLHRKHDKVTSKRLEEARKSFGTDEDLLLVI